MQPSERWRSRRARAESVGLDDPPFFFFLFMTALGLARVQSRTGRLYFRFSHVLRCIVQYVKITKEWGNFGVLAGERPMWAAKCGELVFGCRSVATRDRKLSNFFVVRIIFEYTHLFGLLKNIILISFIQFLHLSRIHA